MPPVLTGPPPFLGEAPGATLPPPLAPPALSPAPAPAQKSSALKKYSMAVLGVFIVVFQLIGKLKFLVLPVLKYGGTVLKTGGSMFVTIWAYAMNWGWAFAAGFVLLIFVHECGHLVAARRCGLKVGAPVFIPFMGAFIALKEAPKNAWIEAVVGIGGPVLGTVGAFGCWVAYALTGNELFRALAYSGLFLNLFNMVPIGFLDGGRVVTALSPWLWVIGVVVMVGFLFLHFNFIVLLILILSVPRIISLFRPKTDEEKRYFEITPAQRWIMAAAYFGLLGALVLGMRLTHFQPAGGS